MILPSLKPRITLENTSGFLSSIRFRKVIKLSPLCGAISTKRKMGPVPIPLSTKRAVSPTLSFSKVDQRSESSERCFGNLSRWYGSYHHLISRCNGTPKVFRYARAPTQAPYRLYRRNPPPPKYITLYNTCQVISEILSQVEKKRGIGRPTSRKYGIIEYGQSHTYL